MEESNEGFSSFFHAYSDVETLAVYIVAVFYCTCSSSITAGVMPWVRIISSIKIFEISLKNEFFFSLKWQDYKIEKFVMTFKIVKINFNPFGINESQLILYQIIAISKTVQQHVQKYKITNDTETNG